MSKRNLNKILPVLCLSLCWVYSCSKNSQDLPIESTYSKSEQAAYDAALIAAPNFVDAIQVEKAAIEAYRVVEEQARATQAEVVQAEKTYEAAKESRAQAKKEASSREKAASEDSAYKAAKAVAEKAYLVHRDARNEADDAALAKTKTLNSFRPNTTIIFTANRKAKKADKTREALLAAHAKTKQALELAQGKVKKGQADKILAAAYEAEKAAIKQVRKAKAQAQRHLRALQAQASEVKAAQARVERAAREVYMAAALGAFKHVAEEAIAKTQAEIAAQH